MDDAASEPGPPRAALGHRCRTCGATQTLAPGAEALACAHCGTLTPIEPATRSVVDHDFEQARRRIRRGPAGGVAGGGHEVQCRHCGARAVTTVHARRCPFCDEPLVVELAPTADTIAPDGVLPFGVDKHAADAAYQRWLRSRWFAPRDLRRRAARDGLDGVYVPYWSFDADSLTRYTGSRGEYYYVEERYTDRDGRRQTRQVRRTHWYGAAGTVRVRFDDVMVCASTGVPRNRMAQLGPWRLEDLRPFDAAYLAGFVAERYAIDLEDGWTEAQAVMEGRITAAVRADIGGDAQRVHSLDIQHRAVTFKHVLLPVWVASYRYRGKVYRVLVNAQTRDVAGDRPWSVAKLAAAVAALALAIVAVVWFARTRPPPAPSPPPPPAALTPPAR